MVSHLKQGSRTNDFPDLDMRADLLIENTKNPFWCCKTDQNKKICRKLVLPPPCKPTDSILSCKQEEELEKMREFCEKNQELLHENNTLKQVEICTDGALKSFLAVGLVYFADVLLTFVRLNRNCCSSKLPVDRSSIAFGKWHQSPQILLLITFHPK